MTFVHDDYSTAAEFLSRHPALRCIDLLLADMNGVLRGKRVVPADLRQVYERGLLLPGSMFALDVLGGTVQDTGLGFDDGDADRPCWPVPGSLQPIPWLGTEVAQLQLSMSEHDGRPFHGDPRHRLGAIVERFAARGLTPVVAVELEFYLVDHERGADGFAQPPRSPLTGRREYRTQINSMADLDAWSELLRDIDATCEAQDVPAATSLTEYGPGQFEVNLRHVGDAQLACDHALRLKRLVKGVALQHGCEATFMAKPYRDMAGSGGHVHVSLLDADGHNIFTSDDPTGSQPLQQAAAGLLATMAESMALFAPNANSFRRLRPRSYVPMHPVWGYNNRGVAVRVPVSGASDRRLEHRVAGADVNPYLLTAAVLAGMLHGLEQELAPPAPMTGNAYHQPHSAPPLPGDWATALSAFARSAVLEDYFGADFMRLYATLKRGEFEDFASHVSPLEHAWFLEPL